MRYLNVCVLVGVLFSMGCQQTHDGVRKYVQSNLGVGVIVAETEVSSTGVSIFITCEQDNSVRLVVAMRNFHQIHIHWSDKLSYVQCDQKGLIDPKNQL